MPLFGNGDVLTFEDYNEQTHNNSVAGVMIARYSIVTRLTRTSAEDYIDLVICLDGISQSDYIQHSDTVICHFFFVVTKFSSHGNFCTAKCKKKYIIT